MTRQARGKRPAYFTCWDCGLRKNTEVTEETYGELSDYFCNHCGEIVSKIDAPVAPQHCPEPREIDLTEPMVCIVSVRITESMIENDDIPF